MKAGEDGGIAPFIPILGTRCAWVVNLTCRPLCRRRSPWYPLKRRLGVPHYRSGCLREEINLLLCLESNH